jgi:hypothetical protein
MSYLFKFKILLAEHAFGQDTTYQNNDNEALTNREKNNKMREIIIKAN